MKSQRQLGTIVEKANSEPSAFARDILTFGCGSAALGVVWLPACADRRGLARVAVGLALMEISQIDKFVSPQLVLMR